ncbi:MAG: hypothetical protein LUC31_00105 [Coprobacillus sp.]|nr:hypothetical protein [Coprobacillus sp.]
MSSNENTTTPKKKSSPLFTAVVLNILLLVLAAIILIYAFSWAMLVVVLVVIALIDYYLYSNNRAKKRLEVTRHDDEFVSLISYLQIYISNGVNVYQAFKMTEPYLSEWMKDKVDTLLNDIDQDKTVQPFINFATNFTLHHYEDILIVIYQMVDQGNNNEFAQKFMYMFEKINEENTRATLESNRNSLDMMGSLPLIGAAVYTVCLTFGIISMLGGVISVL